LLKKTSCDHKKLERGEEVFRILNPEKKRGKLFPKKNHTFGKRKYSKKITNNAGGSQKTK